MRSGAEQFVDPALKAAVQRAWGSQVAPSPLRFRISGLMSATPAPVRRRLQWVTTQSPFQLIASAAVILLVVGLVAFQYNVLFPRSASASLASGVQVSSTIAHVMAGVHDSSVYQHQRQAAAAPNPDYKGIAKALSQMTGARVYAQAIPNWSLVGASVSHVGDRNAAQVLYAQGKKLISVLSMKTPSGVASRGYGNFVINAGEHPIAGFLNGSDLYCVVGSPQTSVSDVAAVKQQVEMGIVRPVTSIGTPLAVGAQ